MSASRNNVQIFKCELREEAGNNQHDENMWNSSKSSVDWRTRWLPDTARWNTVQISKCELQGNRGPLFTWKIDEIRPKASVDCRNAQGQVAARTRGSRNNVQIPSEEREQHVENMWNSFTSLHRATAFPRHRRPCQCTATTTTKMKKALWVPVSVHNRGKRKKHVISYTVHSVDELNLRHHPGSKQDCRTCRCMITEPRRTAPPPPSRPPPSRPPPLPPPSHCLPPPAASWRSSTSDSRHRRAQRLLPRWGQPSPARSQHPPPPPRPQAQREGTVRDAALEGYDSTAPETDVIILTSPIALYRWGHPQRWPLAGFWLHQSVPRKGRTDWLLSPSTTTRWPAPWGVLLLNGYIILKEKLLLDGLTLATFFFVDFRR